MKDLHHYIGSDIAYSATGDLQSASAIERGQQRVLRRLLTNPGEYIFHPEYGAGLPAKVGETLDIPQIRAMIRGQMLLEEAVARTPEPEIIISAIPGGMSCTIRYVDAKTKAQAVLSFNVNK